MSNYSVSQIVTTIRNFEYERENVISALEKSGTIQRTHKLNL